MSKYIWYIRYGDQWWIGATVHGPHGDHNYGNWTWDHNGIEVKWFVIVILWYFSSLVPRTYICNYSKLELYYQFSTQPGLSGERKCTFFICCSYFWKGDCAIVNLQPGSIGWRTSRTIGTGRTALLSWKTRWHFVSQRQRQKQTNSTSPKTKWQSVFVSCVFLP